MKGKTYNLEKLSSSGYFDVSVSKRFYYNTQEYFDELTDFVNNYDRDLRNYTPAFVINSDIDREEFIKECYEIRAYYVRLGMTALIDAIEVMENAAIGKEVKEFSDGQVSYKAKIKICKDAITEAQMRWKMSFVR